MKVEIYTQEGCDYCESVTDWLENNKIHYNETRVSYHNKKRVIAMLTERTKVRIFSFPQIFIDGKYIGRHSDFLIIRNKILEQHKKEMDGNQNILKNGLYLL